MHFATFCLCYVHFACVVMKWNLGVNLHQPSPTLFVWFGQLLIICSLTGLCVMLSFLASYGMYI